MATIDKQQAVDQLARAVKIARSDDLVEIYNELFPQAPTTEDEADKNAPALREKIIEHVESGLKVEEILDLWNVVFPLHHNVWFDDDGEQVHYDEKIEHVGHTD